MTTLAQQLALIFAGMALGWTMLFSFVVAPVSFKDMDQGRADRHVRRVIKQGHGALAGVCVLAAVAALASGAYAAATIAIVCGVFYVMCQWALAPRDDKPIGGHRKLKTARIVASGLTALVMPILIACMVLTRLGI
ncbi:MAG: hypothetical protein AB7L65_01540 [Hyphomonadaceae bacterium]